MNSKRTSKRGTMAAVAEGLDFYDMSEVELRQWVEANPGRVNNMDSSVGLTLLAAIASKKKGLSLVVWLLDEKGADVNRAAAWAAARQQHGKQHGSSMGIRKNHHHPR